MKHFTLFALSLCLLVFAAAGCKNSSEQAAEPRPDQQAEGQVAGGDRDEHGCIGSAGYRWCEPKQECLRFWETPCYDSALEGIKYAFSEKTGKAVTDITLRISKQTEAFARGTVEFAPGGEENTGMFLAYQGNGIWLIAFEGNGAPDCPELINAGFPQEMLLGICD